MPPEARVAIVSSDPEGRYEDDDERHERSGRSRGGQGGWFVDREGHSEIGRAPKKLKEAAIIDRNAFQPDAQAQALLEGVRIAQDGR